MLNKKVSFDDRIFMLLLVWIYISILIVSVQRLTLEFAYQGITYKEPSVINIVFIYLISTLPLVKFHRFTKLPSDFIVFFFYFFMFLPSIIIPFLIIEYKFIDYHYLYYLFFLIISFFILSAKNSNSVIFKIVPTLNQKTVNILIFSFYILCISAFIITFGLRFNLPSIAEVYDVRSDYKDTAENNIYVKYLIGWLGYIINIFVLLIGLLKKKKIFIIIAILVQLYLFTIMALKSHLAVMILAVGVFYYLNRRPQLKTKNMFLLATMLLFILILIDLLIGSTFMEMLITRRAIIIPAQLNYYHVEFFSENPKTHYAYSIFKNIFDYPYKMLPPNVIGDEYFNRPEMTAVVGFLTDGYTAFGLMGMLIVSIIMKFIMNWLDYLYLRSGQNIIILVMTVVILQIFNSSGIFTILLTHGIFLMILLFSVYPWKNLNIKIDID